MIRLNHTGRARFDKKSIDLGVKEENGVALLTFRANLDEYRLPAAASVILEAKRQTTYMRIELGKVSDRRQLEEEPLSIFGSDTNITFTLKVVSSTNKERVAFLDWRKGFAPTGRRMTATGRAFSRSGRPMISDHAYGGWI